MLNKQTQKFNNVLLLIPVIASIVLYYNCIENSFVRWDDDMYLLDNPLLKKITWKNLSAKTVGNYHPFTNLVHAILYKNYGFNPRAFHVFQIVINCINICLISYLIVLYRKPTKTIEYVLISALMLFYCTHPFKVENVAWISEIKDLCFTAFYVLALIIHAKYENKKLYLIVICFIVALMFKSMAITLPVVIFCIEKIKNNSFTISSKNYRVWLIYLVVILFFVAKTFSTQSNTIEDFQIKLYEKPLMVLFSIGFYIVNLIIPVKQSMIHPFPTIYLAGINILYIVLGACFLFFLVVLYFKKQYKYFYLALIFLVILLPIVQIIPLGKSIVSERYMYLASAYVVLLISFVKTDKIAYPVIAVLLGVSLFNSYLTLKRIKVWNTTFSLYTDLKYQYPEYYLSYLALGEECYKLGMFQPAKKYFLCAEYYYNKSGRKMRHWLVDLENLNTNLGRCYAMEKDFKKAKYYFLRALNTGQNRKSDLNNLCGAYMMLNKADSCFFYYSQYQNEFHENIAPIEMYKQLLNQQPK